VRAARAAFEAWQEVSLTRRARIIEVGPGLKPDSEMGPVISPQARDRICGYIRQGPDRRSIYTDEIFGPVLGVVRVPSLQEGIELINRNPYAKGTAIFIGSGQAACTFQRKVHVRMIGVNVPIPVPMAFHSFGGWKDSLFGDHHIHGPEGIRFYTRGKAITARWPEDAQDRTHRSQHMHFPTAV
jgi:malonate-semialdehyde dehydrogenase (acetylating)/methylmalonate-semialdehyde dehydrogenase